MKLMPPLVLLLTAMCVPGVTTSGSFFNSDRFYRIINGTLETLDYLDALERNGTAEQTISDSCKTHLQNFISGVQTGQEWAWRMADAWGNQPAGIFLGDAVWEGSYEGCIRTPDKEPFITGHHCILHYKGALGDDGFGACVPKECNVADTIILLTTGQKEGFLTGELPWQFPSEYSWLHKDSWCIEPASEREFDGGAIAMLVILGIFAAIVTIATSYDVVLQMKKTCCSRSYAVDARGEMMNGSDGRANGAVNATFPTGDGVSSGTRESDDVASPPDEPGLVKESPGGGTGNIEMIGMRPATACATQESNAKDKMSATDVISELVLAFSFIRHVPRLVSFEHGKRSLRCVHGLRSIAFGWIVLGHSWSLGLETSLSVANRDYFIQMKRSMHNQVIERMNYSVETFFVLSGMLVTLSLLRRLEKSNFSCKSVPYYIFHRYLRLSPIYFICLGFWATLFYHLGEGPQFRTEGIADIDGCRLVLWKYMTYLNNIYFLSPGISCFGWGWYLACDFQFYLVAPAYIVALYKKPKLGKALIGIMVIVCIIITCALFITQVRDIGSWFVWVYFPPWSRYSTYLLGIILGYTLNDRKFEPFKIHKAWYTLIWFAVFIVFLTVMYAPYTSHSWPPDVSSFFASIDRTLFGLVVCWILFACLTGTGGIINTILSWNGWLPISRLSYAGYVIHPIIIYYSYYSSPVNIYLTHWTMLNYFIGHLVITLVVSLVVSACVEQPFIFIESTLKKAVKRKRS